MRMIFTVCAVLGLSVPSSALAQQKTDTDVLALSFTMPKNTTVFLPPSSALEVGDKMRTRRCSRIRCRTHRRLEYQFEIRDGWGPIVTLRRSRRGTVEVGAGFALKFGDK